MATTHTPARTSTRRHVTVALVLIGISLVVMLASSVFTAVSALLVAIVVGAIVGNTVALPSRVATSVAISSKKHLRVGIVLLGFKSRS